MALTTLEGSAALHRNNDELDGVFEFLYCTRIYGQDRG